MGDWRSDKGRYGPSSTRMKQETPEKMPRRGKGGGFFHNIRVIAALRTKNRCFHRAHVADAGRAAIALQKRLMHGQYFQGTEVSPHLESSRYKES